MKCTILPDEKHSRHEEKTVSKKLITYKAQHKVLLNLKVVQV